VQLTAGEKIKHQLLELSKLYAVTDFIPAWFLNRKEKEKFKG